LGEATSILSFPRGLWHLWRTLIDEFGGGQKFQIDELILVGDIPDPSLASVSQVITYTNAFIRTLRSAADIDKIVYIPGNHDHTLWTEYVRGRYGEGVNHPITVRGGELLVDRSVPTCAAGCEGLLNIFFGYLDGPAWDRIREEKARGIEFDFSIANPIYAKQFNNRTYVFTHGTHFRVDVTSPRWMKRLIHWTRLDRWLAKIEIYPNCEVREATSLQNLEEIITGFVDSLWCDVRCDPTTRSDHLWYLYSVLSSHFEAHRATPALSRLYNSQDLLTASGDRIIRLDSGDNNSIELLREHFLDHLLNHLGVNLLTDHLTFVYGDTHDGGWGEIPRNHTGQGNTIRVFNCGGWVVHHSDNHPPCHIFAVDDTGEEYILDVSFGGVNMCGNRIIDLASMDFENRRSGISRIFRYLLERFG
jgi:UDP-2,3-diacylglucosamine pyrophosphatase LpxH